MSRTVGRIDRTGSVSFHEASVHVWEESIPSGYGAAKDAWELAFKRQVFARIVQTLNRLGWTCAIPADKVKQYGAAFARSFRECSKGDLNGELSVSGRHIVFQMWQGVNTPTRPDHGGRYESDKEGCMPYVLRMEMERTRRRIRDYLCKVFTGYAFDETKRQSVYPRPMQFTAMEIVQQRYAESRNFKGGDWATYLEKNQGMNYNRKSADGVLLNHGQRVWFADRKGRICEGVAHYNINNMWWVVTGRYSYTNEACFRLFARCPEFPRLRRNAEIRRRRLEQELKGAVAKMDFKRAEVLKQILFPTGPLYAIWHGGHKAYFAIGYCGYRDNLADAGFYTRAELAPYLGNDLQRDELKAVLVREAA